MASPAVSGSIGMGLDVAGGIIKGEGAAYEGEANAAAYRYKAGVALLNKQIDEQNASWSLQTGGIKGMEKGQQAGQEIASTKVMQSGSNLDVNSGTAKAVRDTQTKVTQFDEGVIQWDAAKTAYGYEAKAVTDKAESDLDLMAADQSEKAGNINQMTAWLNAGSSVASKWMQGSQAGMFSGGSA